MTQDHDHVFEELVTTYQYDIEGNEVPVLVAECGICLRWLDVTLDTAPETPINTTLERGTP